MPLRDDLGSRLAERPSVAVAPDERVRLEAERARLRGRLAFEEEMSAAG